MLVSIYEDMYNKIIIIINEIKYNKKVTILKEYILKKLNQHTHKAF